MRYQSLVDEIEGVFGVRSLERQPQCDVDASVQSAQVSQLLLYFEVLRSICFPSCSNSGKPIDRKHRQEFGYGTHSLCVQ